MYRYVHIIHQLETFIMIDTLFEYCIPEINVKVVYAEMYYNVRPIDILSL